MLFLKYTICCTRLFIYAVKFTDSYCRTCRIFMEFSQLFFWRKLSNIRRVNGFSLPFFRKREWESKNVFSGHGLPLNFTLPFIPKTFDMIFRRSYPLQLPWWACLSSACCLRWYTPFVVKNVGFHFVYGRPSISWHRLKWKLSWAVITLYKLLLPFLRIPH